MTKLNLELSTSHNIIRLAGLANASRIVSPSLRCFKDLFEGCLQPMWLL